jgi:hypothetical protein
MKQISFAVISALLLSITGCKEKDPCKDNAGYGGSVNVKLSLLHHSRQIKNKIGYPDSVYVFFNTNDLPTLKSDGSKLPVSYDALVLGTDTATNSVTVTGLQCGDYYFYGAAMDSAGPYRVLGGIPYTISEDASGEISLTLPVTEGD